jgi:hypothetical protein
MTRTAGGNVPLGLAEIPQRGEDKPHGPLLVGTLHVESVC